MSSLILLSFSSFTLTLSPILSIFPQMYNSNLPFPLPPMIIWWQIATAVILNLGYSNSFLIGLLVSVLASLQHILYIAVSMIVMKCIPGHFTSLLKILFMSSHYSEVQNLLYSMQSLVWSIFLSLAIVTHQFLLSSWDLIMESRGSTVFMVE